MTKYYMDEELEFNPVSIIRSFGYPAILLIASWGEYTEMWSTLLVDFEMMNFN